MAQKAKGDSLQQTSLRQCYMGQAPVKQTPRDYPYSSVIANKILIHVCWSCVIYKARIIKIHTPI